MDVRYESNMLRDWMLLFHRRVEDTLKVFLSSRQWNGLYVGVESFCSIVLSFWLCGDEFKQPNNSPKNVLRIPAQLKSAARWCNTTCHFLSCLHSSMSLYFFVMQILNLNFLGVSWSFTSNISHDRYIGNIQSCGGIKGPSHVGCFSQSLGLFSKQNESFSSPFLFSFASVLCLGQFDSSRSAAVHWSHFVHFWSLHFDANQTHGLLHHQRRSFPMSTTTRDWREATNYSIPKRFRHRTIGSSKVSENVKIFFVSLFLSRFKLNCKFYFDDKQGWTYTCSALFETISDFWQDLRLLWRFVYRFDEHFTATASQGPQ